MSYTIKDIAKMAGVSKGTVSRVINNNPDGVSDETRSNILKLIDEVGYVPNRIARSITVSETKTIGLIIPDVQNPFFPQAVRGVEDCAMENGYTVFLCNSDSNIEKEQTYLYTFLEKRVDGIIINSCGEYKDRKLNDLIHNSKIPIVLFDRKTKDLADFPGVYVDNSLAAFEGVAYLIKNGAKNICYMGGENGVYTAEKRLNGYIKALESAGAQIRQEYISFGEYSINSGYERTKQIVKKHPEIDAIFAGSDIIAIGVLKALNEMNIRVPEKIEILGFDNIIMSEVVMPALSTIGQPIYQMGYKTAQKLISFIQDKKGKQEDEFLKTDLVIRQSIKKR